MKRDIITIDEEKCNGCGDCIPNCPEGAIQVIDEKARLISDLMCDGLGACVGHCPEGAITLEQREAEPYDEHKVMANIVRQGAKTIKAHLAHLQEHRQTEYYAQALAYLEEHQVALPIYMETKPQPGGCPGSRAMAFAKDTPEGVVPSGQRPSGLTHWPIQM
ncbi:MAG: 4Fe-4S binding protein, partial [Armatimonadetes bacterium]|nr:4Fe-4S binding protein [Armatimonadota bacterium]